MIHMMHHRSENELRAAFRTMGATSPATARAGKDLVVDKRAFDDLLRRGVIRESAPGTYYLYEASGGARQIVMEALFWAALVLLPVGIMQFCS